MKSLQFRKLYRSEDESAEEWMGQLHMAAAECWYKEIDRLLKEQFIRSLNDKSMLDKIIRELTSRNSNMQTTSEDVLVWAKRVEAQRVQASLLNDITETKAFNKVNKETESKNAQGREVHIATHQRQPCRYCGGSHIPRQCLAYGKTCAACGKMEHFRKVCRSKRNWAVHEVEIDMEPESQEDTEVVSINSLYINRTRSLIMVKLEMQVGKKVLEIPYKIDMGSEGNLMLLYIFQKLFANMRDGQMKRSVKGNIRLKMYNGTHIMQLGMCAVQIKFKNIKKRCVFFVVPGNGQVLLGMSDTVALNLINLNIDSIQVITAKCKTNKEQEACTSIEGCTNKNTTWDEGCKNNSTSADNKQDTNGHSHPCDKHISINYFHSLNNIDADKRSSIAMTQSMHSRFGDIFNGIGCFEGPYSLQLKPHSKPYQVQSRHVAYALQEPFKEELGWLQEMDIITPLGVDETSEWCNSFVSVPKANGKVRLCLDPACLNQALIRPVHRGPTFNNILPKLNNLQYMSIINGSSGYHKLKLDKQPSYLTTFSCPLGKYWHKCLPFRAVPAGNIFQCKKDKIFNDVPNVFGIADDILVIGYDKDGEDHDKAVYKVLRQCQDVNLKLNKEKCHLGVQPDAWKVKTLTKMPAPKNKKELQAFLGTINYLGKFSPGTAEVCEPLHKLTSCKMIWTWNASYQQLFDNAKSIIKADVCMKFYNNSKQLYLETDASGIGLGAALLQFVTTWSVKGE